MSTNEMAIAVKQLRELRRMSEELETEMETIKDQIKQHMTMQNVDELIGTDWKVTYKTVNSSRFDTKAFRKDHAVMAEKYTKQTSVRRLTIA
ncbi:MAG: hypothetical protein Q4D42_10640 [Eubacteriales bacterium]|nr:hypothetical protein [Eubacteriales bacterium]